MRNYHDMGGLPAGTVVPGEHDYALWEKRVDAMQMLLKDKQLLKLLEFKAPPQAGPHGGI